MTGRSFTVAALAMLSVRDASKVTSWAAASCFHGITSWTEKVRGPTTKLSLLSVRPPSLNMLLLCDVPVTPCTALSSGDMDDWDQLEVHPGQAGVQNFVYLNDEEQEEDDGDEVEQEQEGRKVTVRKTIDNRHYT